MTAQLPPNLLALFQPRPPLRWLNPSDYAPEDRTTAKVDGVAQYVQALQEKKEEAKNDPVTLSHLERADRDRLERIEKQKWLMSEGYKQLYKPTEDPNVRGDAFKTLFVGRLDYKATTKDLEDAFGRFGDIERVRIVQDRSGKPGKNGSRGYAFLLFATESACKAAYKDGEYTVIKGRRCLVDVERGRTVSGWRPRRFGGGLGGRHYTKAVSKPAFGHGPPPGPGFGRPGFRGGFGGDRGFRGGGRQGSGGFRPGGGSYGGRGGMGYQNGGPDGAPSGPRQGGRPGGGYSNANHEPLPPRGGGGSYRDRDNFSSGQKRPHDGGYDDSRQRRRY